MSVEKFLRELGDFFESFSRGLTTPGDPALMLFSCILITALAAFRPSLHLEAFSLLFGVSAALALGLRSKPAEILKYFAYLTLLAAFYGTPIMVSVLAGGISWTNLAFQIFRVVSASSPTIFYSVTFGLEGVAQSARIFSVAFSKVIRAFSATTAKLSDVLLHMLLARTARTFNRRGELEAAVSSLGDGLVYVDRAAYLLTLAVEARSFEDARRRAVFRLRPLDVLGLISAAIAVALAMI